MSDPHPDDEAQPPAPDGSVAAARKLGEPLASPLEQKIRPADPAGEPGVPPMRRDAPYRPADATATGEPVPAPPAAAAPPEPALPLQASSRVDPLPAGAVGHPVIAPAWPSAEPPDGDGDPPLDADAARLVRRVRRMMLVSALTTVVAVAAVFGVIGYRVYKSADRLPQAPLAAPVPAPAATKAPLETTLTLPTDARIVYTTVAEDLLVVSLDIGGRIEIRTFDLKTLKPAGRISFIGVP
jgi:hypothetical protein